MSQTVFLQSLFSEKIEAPLDILTDGVHQIRDGNLDYRITYNEQDEFQSVCEDFNDMAVRLRESVEITQKNEQNRKELIAGISHDLRTPLTSIKAYIEGLLEGVAATPQMQREIHDNHPVESKRHRPHGRQVAFCFQSLILVIVLFILRI